MFFYKILYLYTNVSENFNCFLMKLKFKCGYWKKKISKLTNINVASERTENISNIKNYRIRWQIQTFKIIVTIKLKIVLSFPV